MSFFTRRKAFILVQELSKLEDTKELLSSKLEYLKQQTKLSLDSILKQDLVTPEFTKSMLFWLDFQEKILSSLIHLNNSSNLGWKFLNTFKNNETKHFVFGEFTKPGFIIDTEYISKNSDSYFFDLLKLGNINIKTWTYLKKLKSCVNNISAINLNDSSYYDFKKFNIIEPINDIEDFKEIEEDFNSFLRKNLPLTKEKPVLWNFLKASQKNKNYPKIAEILFNCSYRYEEIRNRSETKAFLSPIQFQELFYSLAQLNNFTNLYQAAFELNLYSDKITTAEVLKFCFLYFLNQNTLNLSLDNPEYTTLSFYEKFVRSILYVDLMIFVCKHEINLFSHKKYVREPLQEKFKKACEIELFALKDQEVIRNIFIFDFSIITFLLNKIDELQSLPFYTKTYSKFIDPLLIFKW